MHPKVFYTWPQAIEGFEDGDFGKNIQWDIPLLEGYEWEAVENDSKIPNSKSWKGIDCPKLIAQIKAFQPDAILVYGWNLKSHFNVMRHFKDKVPLWFFGDSTLLDEKPGWKKIARRIWLRWVYRHIDKAFYVGTNNRNYFLAHGIKEKQLVFFPHAIDNDRFAESEENQYEDKAKKWRKELGYADDDIVVLFAGKFESKKQPAILVDAVQQINKEDRQANKPIKLLLIGNGPLETALRGKAKNDANIQFLPFQNQAIMPIIYRLGNIFCLPSQSETWGLAVNEAMACSRPSIVSNRVGCAVDLIEEHKTGKVFTFDETDKLNTAIISMLSIDLKATGRQSFELIENWNYTAKCTAIEKKL